MTNSLLTSLEPHSSKRISEYAQRHPEVVDLTVGLPGFRPPAAFGRALAELVTRGGTTVSPLDRYAHSRGAAELRAAIANLYAVEQNVTVDPDTQVLVTNGAAGALWTAILTVTEPGDEVLLADPCYMIYPSMIELLGRRVVRVPAGSGDDFGITADQVRAHLTRRSRVVLVNAPANPTGAVTSATELAALCALAADNGLHIVHDEVLDRFTEQPRHSSVLSVAPQGVGMAVNSLSKRFAMAGWRVGWLVAAPDVIAQAAKAHTFFQLAVNHAVQRAAAVALTDPGTEAEVAGNATRTRDQCRRFLAGLRTVRGFERCRVPDGGFYAFLDVREFAAFHGIAADGTRRLSESVANYLLHERGIAVVPGTAFGAAGEGFVRVSAGGEERQLEVAVSRLAKE